jgi:hypothetical protein
MYDVSDQCLFQGPLVLDDYPRAMVVVKQTKRASQDLKRAFYLEEMVNASDEKTARGFKSGLIKGKTLAKEFLSQQVTERRNFEVYAHLAIVPNPFQKDSREGRHYVVVLNGVSGPATFALTHVLTGGANEEFVSYSKFNPEAESENVLNQILKLIPARDFRGLECIVKITVGPADIVADEAAGTGNMFDWRQILSWKLEEEAWDRKITLL